MKKSLRIWALELNCLCKKSCVIMSKIFTLSKPVFPLFNGKLKEIIHVNQWKGVWNRVLNVHIQYMLVATILLIIVLDVL